MTTQTMHLAHLDPGELAANQHNPRGDLGDLTELTDSIRAQGVLQPLLATENDADAIANGSDTYTIIAGHRRAAAALAAGLDTVPVILIPASAHTTASEIEAALAENLHRRDLTTSDQVHAVQQLLALGLDTDQIAKDTGLAKTRARDLGNIAQAATSRPDLTDVITTSEPTIDQALALVEFDDDAEALDYLTKVLTEEPEDFDYRVQEQRDARARAIAITKRTDELADQGVTTFVGWKNVPAAAERIYAGNHKKCPHRVVMLQAFGSGDDITVHESEYCLKIKTHNTSTKSDDSTTPAEAEAATRERRRVIANNKAMATSNTYRRDWIRAYLKSKHAHAPIAAIAQLLGRHSRKISDFLVLHANLDKGLDAVGWTHGIPETATTKNDDKHGTAYLLAFTAAAMEHRVEKDAWKHNSWGLPALTDWLTVIQQLGYRPSPIERAILHDSISTYHDQPEEQTA